MSKLRPILGLVLLIAFLATLVLWANVEFRRHGTLVAEVFWLFTLVGLPAGLASAVMLWRWHRQR